MGSKTEGGPTPLGRRVMELRKAAGLTQVQLAEKVGLGPSGQSRIGQIERGDIRDPGGTLLQALADALGVPIWDLIPDAPRPVVEKSLRLFLESELAEDVTPEEIATLQQMRPRGGTPTVRTWMLLLEAIRSMRNPS